MLLSSAFHAGSSQRVGDARYGGVAGAEFNYVTPEYQMKWEPTERAPGVFDYTQGDQLVTFAEQHGRCHHPITGGTGGFAGATGVVHFKDDPVTGCAYYSGHVALGG